MDSTEELVSNIFGVLYIYIYIYIYIYTHTHTHEFMAATRIMQSSSNKVSTLVSGMV